MQKVHRHFAASFWLEKEFNSFLKLRLIVSIEFQVSISLPSKGFFSPFPHGTCSLSVIEIYLGFEAGPPIFKQDKSRSTFTKISNYCIHLNHLSYRVITFFDKSSQSFLISI